MSDLDPDEAMAMQREADRLEREQYHAESLEGIRQTRQLFVNEREHSERQHAEHMALLDRIAAALEKLAGRKP